MCSTSGTTVVIVCGTGFTVTFLQPDLHYHIRAGSSAERDRWVVALADAIRKQSEAASPAALPPPAPAINFVIMPVLMREMLQKVVPKTIK